MTKRTPRNPEKPAPKCRPPKAGNFEKVVAKLQAAAAASVATLHASLFDGSPSTRIRAAAVILNLAITSTEIEISRSASVRSSGGSRGRDSVCES